MNKLLLSGVILLSAFSIGQNKQIKSLQNENNMLDSAKMELQTEIAEQAQEIEVLTAGYYADLPIEMQFKIAAQAYEVDWKLTYSIAAHETGWFTSRLYLQQNNPGGIKAGSGWAEYANSFQGILEMTRLIKKSYIDKGLDTPQKMESKYCPDGSSWAAKVTKIMSGLE